MASNGGPAVVRVLIAEREALICRTVASALSTIGCQCDFAQSQSEARHLLERSEYQLLILDRLLQEDDGAQFLRWLRQDLRKQMPVIMLAASPREEQKLAAFELGVDDFIAKPFSPREVTARSLAVLRRSALGHVYTFGPFRLDTTARTLFRGTDPVHLRPKEFDLLAALCKHSGEALSKDQLFMAVWGDKKRARREAVAVAVHSLRQKMEPDPNKRQYIRTVPSFGYRFEADQAAGSASLR